MPPNPLQNWLPSCKSKAVTISSCYIPSFFCRIPHFYVACLYMAVQRNASIERSIRSNFIHAPWYSDFC